MTYRLPPAFAPRASRPARGRRTTRARIALAVAVVGVAIASQARAADVSAPALLQWFEGSWQTLERRTADVWKAGYGGVWTPPPGRADSGNWSVGYDQYDRFDLGSAGNFTMYGSEAGLKSMVSQFHRAGVRSYIDLVWNHNGYSDWWSTDGSGKSFLSAGGYPGFWMDTGPNGNKWGDFHSVYASGDYDGKTSNLVDIAQESNNVFVRNPVPGYANNVPAGTQYAYGRIANVPTEANRRFYPDQQSSAILVFDPTTGQSGIPIYSYNQADPTAGDPVAENALGYLMRNTRWLVEVIGTDGFRLDATKHLPPWVLNYYDRAVYRAIQKPLLDGSTQHVWGFGEYYGGDMQALQDRRRNDINPNDPGRVGGNRDNLDFPLYWAMSANLSGNGLQNDWRNVVNASFDRNDDGDANNGSQGVAFVESHDGGGAAPYLSSVAYAYTLMRPGNAVVYFNGKEFGNNRDFPRDGRGDALGGLYGNAIPNLVDVRNRYGRGDYQERWVDKETLIYERENSALVVLSNRLDGGYDTRTVQTGFAPGTRLVDLTGNASNATADPNNDIADVLVVGSDGKVTLRVLRNAAPGTGTFTGSGFLIYGPKSPVGTLTLSNVAGTMSGGTPTAGTNGSTRLADVKVITGDSFAVTLNTSAVTLSDGYRDRDADGDNAVLMFDDGLDVNGNGQVDYRTPGSVVYGFEEFATTRSPGYSSPTGNGTYAQAVDATELSEGYHYITARAFRKRGGGEPAIFSDFKQAIYVDRLDPVSQAASFNATVAGTNETRTAVGKSLDLTADNMHFFLDLPAGLTDAQVLARVGSGSQASRVDRDQWTRQFANVSSGNHVLTLVTYEVTGNVSVQRFPGWSVSSIIGRGVGDTNFSGTVTSSDMTTFQTVVQSNNAQFNPAADVDADGRVDLSDVFLMGPRLTQLNVDGSTWTSYNNIVNSPFVKSGTYTVSGSHAVYDVTAGTTAVTGGATLQARSIRGNALTVGAGGTARLTPNGTSAGTSRLSSLAIADGGTLDLADNDLVLDYAGATPAGAVRTLLRSGRAGGTWDGDTGIVSSPAAADAQQRTAIGYAEASLVLGLAGTATATWSGQTVDATSLLLKYTYYGDANLDGSLTLDDYVRLDRGLAMGLSGWFNGDFNYDDVVNSADYLLIDMVFVLQSGGLSADLLASREAQFGDAYVASLVASVPEPSATLVAPAAAIALAALHRRRRQRPDPRPHREMQTVPNPEVRP